MGLGLFYGLGTINAFYQYFEGVINWFAGMCAPDRVNYIIHCCFEEIFEAKHQTNYIYFITEAVQLNRDVFQVHVIDSDGTITDEIAKMAGRFEIMGQHNIACGMSSRSIEKCMQQLLL